jgi:hypothetical protein
MRFFFDVRNDGTLVIDDIGLELLDLQTASGEAAAILAEKTEDMFSGVLLKELSIEIRDAFGVIAMTVTLIMRVMTPVIPFRKL